MRVFADPNGSGKSTVINKVRNQQVNGRTIDFGYYINADDIERFLQKGSLSFADFDITTSNKEFKIQALESGLINVNFPEASFASSYSLRSNLLSLRNEAVVVQLAQITADFLRKKLLRERKRFSFETVFSHRSKLEIMKEAADLGYKVYLYFVSTNDPQINQFRVAARVEKGGHAVESDKIIQRYYRSMDFLYEACQIAYQVYFFDNSKEGEDSSTLFAHFKKTGEEKRWDPIIAEAVPDWFKLYYSAKIKRQ